MTGTAAYFPLWAIWRATETSMDKQRTHAFGLGHVSTQPTRWGVVCGLAAEAGCWPDRRFETEPLSARHPRILPWVRTRERARLCCRNPDPRRRRRPHLLWLSPAVSIPRAAARHRCSLSDSVVVAGDGQAACCKRNLAPRDPAFGGRPQSDGRGPARLAGQRCGRYAGRFRTRRRLAQETGWARRAVDMESHGVVRAVVASRRPAADVGRLFALCGLSADPAGTCLACLGRRHASTSERTAIGVVSRHGTLGARPLGNSVR